ncbi:sugar phosphate isomerase/epimerase [Mucilaginibacter sp. 14171R-50]|uniref:sugar phosphate isomerase/epimerase n=1 Tax=Mucilaginibacter sp. 14171R-50 TaxID=2703789 RepID=UPI00138C3A02|nr:sugar phosphate isomerase/epimerase [Mucilaginibacter sp. 14171R-50]QHS56484.1 sugar phosphate isomerase/epimerase [Mucilaginibacter sp. 14171R-50]
MELKILCPLWGHGHLPIFSFLEKVRSAGFDGFDTWIPEDKVERQILYDYLQQFEMPLVAHQYQAHGATFRQFKASFIKRLTECAVAQPVLINSHTGRDWFTVQENIELIDIAHDFSIKTGIPVVHETHRGRLGYAPQSAAEMFQLCEQYLLTADFSHWTCVTESMLENFEHIMDEAIKRTRHVHARIGHENGPQVPDPRASEWSYASKKFLTWWERIVLENKRAGRLVLTFTTEFGPPPYMPTLPFSNAPVADPFEINCFMKDVLKSRYTDLAGAR